MSNKPIIGINGDFRPERKDCVALSWYNAGYYDHIMRTEPGGIPVLIPPIDNDEDLRELLQQLDGLVLTGSNLDMDPVRLGMEKHPATRPMPARREDFDRRLCRLAVELRMPILAIGVGMQMLNVVCGGSLIQHIPEEVGRAMLHRDQVERRLRHAINIVPGTRVDQIYGPGEIRVNSQHHMAVGRLAPIFRVSATTSDGVIEAYESVDEDWFCLGIQWHPENETASALDNQVFEAFLKACASEAEPVILQMTRRAA